MKHIFIVNPFSGHKNGAATIPLIEEICIKNKLDFEVIVTEYPKHATEIAERYFEQNEIIVYSVGGDGTAFEIMNGLHESVPLAIIPCGTGNDYFKSITNLTDLKDYIQNTVVGKKVLVDYGIHGDMKFLNCTTMGLDAQVNETVSSRLRNIKLPGIIKYLYAAILEVLNLKVYSAEIEVDGKKWKQDIILAAIMNGKAYGGGFTPTPLADIQDGEFDIVVVEPLKKFKIFILLLKYMKGDIEHIKEVKTIRGKSITINCDKEIQMQTDGESFLSKSITINCVHHKLPLMVPHISNLKAQ